MKTVIHKFILILLKHVDCVTKVVLKNTHLNSLIATVLKSTHNDAGLKSTHNICFRVKNINSQDA